MPHLLILNGPNLNLLGSREPEIYGHAGLAEVEHELAGLAAECGFGFEMRQSNHEGDLIDWLHEARETADGVILNPGGLTHTSVALADAVAASGLPTIEVHVSNIHAREPIRARSFVARVALGTIAGLGVAGYALAARALLDRIAPPEGDRTA